MNASASRLSGITRDLWNRWLDTKTAWRDVKGQDFEEKYLVDLVSSADKTVAVIEQLDKLLLKIKKDCE